MSSLTRRRPRPSTTPWRQAFGSSGWIRSTSRRIARSCVCRSAPAGVARLDGARVLVGRSNESEQVLAFGPWIDALRSVDVAGDEALLATLRPAWRAELARLLPELEAPGLPAAGQDSRRLFESVV